MEKINTSELENMIRSNFLDKGASEDEIKEEIVKSITEKIKNKSREGVESAEQPQGEDIVDVNISKPQDVEGKIPDAVTSSTSTPKEYEDISNKQLELEEKEKELLKREEELNRREEYMLSQKEDDSYEPELPEQIEEIEPEKLFVFDKNMISVGAEKLSTLEMNLVSNPEEKSNMRTLWLKDAIKDVELYVANFEKIGNIEFDPFGGTAEIKETTSKDVEEINAQNVKLDFQGNMKDSIEPIANVSNRTINEGAEANLKSEQLSEDILSSIIKIDNSMPYQDFAIAVARVLEDSYGSHNYVPFVNFLRRQLNVLISDLKEE